MLISSSSIEEDTGRYYNGDLAATIGFFRAAVVFI